MAVRFRKSFKLAPGVRMNLSGGGLSWSLGPRGASVNIGKRGTYLNTGIPGTGFSMRQSLAATPAAARSASRPPPSKVRVDLTVAVANDGTVTFVDANGDPVSETLIAMAKRQRGDEIMDLIQRKCAEINGQVSALGEIHLDTPGPTNRPCYQPAQYSIEAPRAPLPKVPGFIDGFFKSRRKLIEDQNAAAEVRHRRAVDEWAAEKVRFEQAEAQKLAFLEMAMGGNTDAMEEFFQNVLSDIVWPRETDVSFEVRESGRKLVFDVDLPEIEDMPTKTASVPQRGYRLSVKDMGQTAVQKLYAQHVHSIAFRLVGEAFGMLPTLQEVTLSGYTQRKDKATGHTVDHYLLSVVVTRAAWSEINFANLGSIDVVDALARFQLRRDMTKAGAFKPIESF